MKSAKYNETIRSLISASVINTCANGAVYHRIKTSSGKKSMNFQEASGAAEQVPYFSM